jgi:hypothetical protein
MMLERVVKALALTLRDQAPGEVASFCALLLMVVFVLLRIPRWVPDRLRVISRLLQFEEQRLVAGASESDPGPALQFIDAKFGRFLGRDEPLYGAIGAALESHMARAAADQHQGLSVLLRCVFTHCQVCSHRLPDTVEGNILRPIPVCVPYFICHRAWCCMMLNTVRPN